MDESRHVRRTWPDQSRPVVLVLLALAIVGVGGGAWLVRPRPPSDRFCTMELAATTVDGLTAELQDEGSPGHDGSCDLSDHGMASIPGMLTLGWDCKVRSVTGTVVATTTPNRPDGTCGQLPGPTIKHQVG